MRRGHKPWWGDSRAELRERGGAEEELSAPRVEGARSRLAQCKSGWYRTFATWSSVPCICELIMALVAEEGAVLWESLRSAKPCQTHPRKDQKSGGSWCGRACRRGDGAWCGIAAVRGRGAGGAVQWRAERKVRPALVPDDDDE